MSRNCMYCGEPVINPKSKDWHTNSLCTRCHEWGRKHGTGPS